MSAMRCNRCHRPMPGTTAYDGTCECGGLIELSPSGAENVLLSRTTDSGIPSMKTGDSQGLCETTMTERFEVACQCGTYEGNLGACKTFLAGADPARCVYCDHKAECHVMLAEKK